ncbi:ankyrin repeat domain-containing protein [Rudaeicoccus suwonensis]|uniref:Ankyrin repeat protein n=1 Tax=Rudaeicoccus suwonensis TaxID=657409 RepID=A0A561EAU3_9MICO|nr:ankyrin repeat domain-containing protein [Rudaeicoccus suwonensis]TWE12730.1 ankyrin repeat protein [Rudaeicoccus suwonensis]
MSKLPPRPHPDHLRRQAKDLLAAAKDGTAVLESLDLNTAQRTIARDYGFTSWPRLMAEVERRVLLDSRDPARIAALLAQHPDLAVARLHGWSDHSDIRPLQYVASMRCAVGENVWRDMPGTGRIAQALLAAGAPLNGGPGDRETPLITAASYGDTEVAHVLIAAGADLERLSTPDAGGVPNASALTHAAVFGMSGVLDLLVHAGASYDSLPLAAAVGDLTGWDLRGQPRQQRLLALIMAADHERLEAVDALLGSGVPIDGEDREFGRQALRLAAERGRAASVSHLLAHGADPHHRDPVKGRTALYWCRRGAKRIDHRSGHADVDRQLSAALHLSDS